MYLYILGVWFMYDRIQMYILRKKSEAVEEKRKNSFVTLQIYLIKKD